MTANSNSKLKILYIKQMLEEQTDGEHGLTMADIIEGLEERGISAERKGIYRDIEVLRAFGMKIEVYERNPREYALARRLFNLSELMLLTDAVESSKFLTRRQANELERKIQSLASMEQSKALKRSIHVTDRINSKKEGVFSTIDSIHEAMRGKVKVGFNYMHYGIDGKRHASNGGGRYEVTPVGISYDQGFYYLTAWNPDSEDMREYRLDRMDKLMILEDAADRNEQISAFRPSDESYQIFGRSRGETRNAILNVKNDKVEILYDRFGKNLDLVRLDDETARVTVKVQVSDQFFGWVAGLRGVVSIAAPQSLVDDYKAFLEDLLESVE